MEEALREGEERERNIFEASYTGSVHELNNQLGAMLQNIQNIQRRISPGLPANDTVAGEVGVDLSLVADYLQKRGIPELLSHISNAGTHASDIVARMLAFSRKTRGIDHNAGQTRDQVTDHR
jgi:hypothetical protein